MLIRKVLLLVCSAVLLGSFVTVTFAQERNPTPEEIIAKHLASIGTPKERERNRLRMAVASSAFSIIGIGARNTDGGAIFASDGENMALVSTFKMQDYRMERIGVFGSKIEIPFVDTGRRSPLGNFLSAYDKLLADHLLGGAIFSTWLFEKNDDVSSRLKNDGKKKLRGRDVWVLSYTPKGGLASDSSIKLYFDAENFQHMRTVYHQKETEGGNFTPAGRTGSGLDTANGDWTDEMASHTHMLSEDFEDIHSVGGVTLPHKYTITLDIDSVKGTSHFIWKFVINEYKLVKEFPAGTFKFGDLPTT